MDLADPTETSLRHRIRLADAKSDFKQREDGVKKKTELRANPFVVWCESEQEGMYIGVSLAVDSAKDVVPLHIPASGKFLYDGIRAGYSQKKCLQILRRKTGLTILADELDIFLDQLVKHRLLIRSRSQ